jgi:hypothetical protein
MSRLAPDIPELQGVPEAARSLVYVRALLAANRSPLTWLIGAIVFAVAVGGGARLGTAFVGTAGGLLGTVLGAAAALWGFFKAILPWRARRLLPSVMDQVDGTIVDQVQQADERVRRMVDVYKRQDARGSDDV